MGTTSEWRDPRVLIERIRECIEQVSEHGVKNAADDVIGIIKGFDVVKDPDSTDAVEQLCAGKGETNQVIVRDEPVSIDEVVKVRKLSGLPFPSPCSTAYITLAMGLMTDLIEQLYNHEGMTGQTKCSEEKYKETDASLDKLYKTKEPIPDGKAFEIIKHNMIRGNLYESLGILTPIVVGLCEKVEELENKRKKEKANPGVGVMECAVENRSSFPGTVHVVKVGT